MLHIIIAENRSKMDLREGPVQASSLERKACRKRENVRVALILEIGLILFEMRQSAIRLKSYVSAEINILVVFGYFAKLPVMPQLSIIQASGHHPPHIFMTIG